MTTRIDAALDKRDIFPRVRRLEELHNEFNKQFIILESLADTALFSDSKHNIHAILDEAYLRIRKLLLEDKAKIV